MFFITLLLTINDLCTLEKTIRRQLTNNTFHGEMNGKLFIEGVKNDIVLKSFNISYIPHIQFDKL